MEPPHQPCPCCSGKPYANCCQKYHKGVLPENPLVLMRSRYSAYAKGISNYLIETTHPESPHFVNDKKQWAYQIRIFCNQASFDGLEILETKIINDDEGSVAFIAHLSRGDTDLTFTEKSRFLKQGHAWKYFDGKIGKGRLTLKQICDLK